MFPHVQKLVRTLIPRFFCRIDSIPSRAFLCFNPLSLATITRYFMCGHQAERPKAIRHIDNIFKQPKEGPVKLVEILVFKDILTSENPGNNSIFNFYRDERLKFQEYHFLLRS